MANDVAIAAAFLAGFHRMMALLLNLNGSFLTLIRFGISPSKIGCFIGDTGSCMQFWNNWGILLSFGLTFCGWTDGKAFIAPILSFVIYFLAFAYTWRVKLFDFVVGSLGFIILLVIVGFLFALAAIQGSNPSKKGEYAKYVCPVVSILSSVCVFVAYCMLARVCLSSHGYEGVRKLFFWLCASAFAYQFDQCMVTKVNGAQTAWFFLALELFGPLLPLVHWLAGLFGKCFGSDVESCKLVSQIGMMILCTSFGMLMWWINAVIQIIDAQSISADKSAVASLKRCLSPGVIGVIGLGSIFWLFPVVWPFMVCHYSRFQFVMFFCPILGASATLIIWFISEGHVVLSNFIGDIKMWTLFDNWDRANFGAEFSGGRMGTSNAYHATWGLCIFIFILCWIIVCCIHYPRCFIARSVLHSGWAVFWGGCLYFITQLFKAVGLTGVFANAIGCGLRVVFEDNVTIQFKDVSGSAHTAVSSVSTLTINSPSTGINLNSDGYFDYAAGVRLDSSASNNVFKPGFAAGTFTGKVGGSSAIQTKPVSLACDNTGTVTFDTTPKVTFSSLKFGVPGLTNDNNANKNKVKELAIFMGADTGSTTTLQVDGSKNNSLVFNLAFTGEADLAAQANNPVSGTLNFAKSRIQILGNLAHGSTFGNVFVDLALFHMTASLFTAQAYSVGVGSFKCAVESGSSWPTQGVGGFRSFRWWLRYSVRHGNRRFRSLADVDIIQVIS